MKYWVWTLGLIGFFLVGWYSVEAVNYRVDFESNVGVDSDTRGNVYRIGERVDITAPVSGDIVAIGGTVSVNEGAGEDVWIVGDSVSVSGNHTGDVRVAASRVNLSGTVQGETLILASQVEIEPGTQFEGDVLILAGTVNISAEALGTVEIRATQIDIEGTFIENVSLYGDRVSLAGSYAEEMTIRAIQSLAITSDESTEIASVRYWAPESNPDLESNVNGDVRYDETLLRDGDRARLETGSIAALRNEIFSFFTVLRVLSAGLVIALISALFARFWDRISFSLDTPGKLLQSAGIGLAAVLLIPVLSALLMITIVAIPLALVLLIGYGIALFFGMSIVSVVLARRMNRAFSLEATQLRLFFLAWGIYTAILISGIILPGFITLMSFILIITFWGAVIRFYSVKDTIIHKS